MSDLEELSTEPEPKHEKIISTEGSTRKIETFNCNVENAVQDDGSNGKL